MGRAYVVLEQPELALHFIQQAEEIYGSQSIPLERMKTAITSQAGEMDESPSAVEMRSSSYNGEKNEAKKSKVALKSRSYEPLSKSLSTPETPSLYFKTMAEVHQRLERYDEANDWYDQYKRTTTNEAELKKADYARGENFYKSGNFEANHCGVRGSSQKRDARWQRGRASRMSIEFSRLLHIPREYQ